MSDRPTMQEIDEWYEKLRTKSMMLVDCKMLADLCAAARRGVEADRLRAERNEHARWRSELADKLHAAEAELAALKAAQPQEYPSSADDEATRWRHGEPTQPERVSVPVSDERIEEAVQKGMRLAWQLGQTYWQQADSESWKQNAMAKETVRKFDQLLDETIAILAAAQEGK